MSVIHKSPDELLVQFFTYFLKLDNFSDFENKNKVSRLNLHAPAGFGITNSEFTN